MLLTFPTGQTLDIEVDDTSYRRREIMGDDTLMLYFSLAEFVDIPRGTWCEFKAARYFLLKPAAFTKQHTRHWQYILEMDSATALMKNVKCKFFSLDGNVPDSPFELKYSLTETPARFARLLADNMNLADPDGGWTPGECIAGDPVTVDFNHDSCHGVLAKVAEAFHTEWEVEGKVIRFRRVEKEKDSPVPLAYGYNRGLKPGVGRRNYDNSKVIDRLFIEGGNRNIDRSRYGAAALHMPGDRTTVYEDVTYRTDPTGTYIERAGRTGQAVEDSLDLTHVYPSHTGTVSRTIPFNPDKHLYDIVDDSIPAALDYAQCIVPGETMTVRFQTGQLAGREFEASYRHDERRFALVPSTEGGLTLPAGNLLPEAGDRYAVFHVMLPEAYVAEAEERMLAEAVKYLWENGRPKYTFTGTLDELYASRHWGALAGRLDCGYFVAFADDQFLAEPVPIRITAVKEYVNSPRRPEITLSNEVSGRTLSSALGQIPAGEQAADRKTADVMRYARRRWQDTEEFIRAMYDPSGTFQEDLISSLVLEAMTLRLGDPSLQFVFLAADWLTVVPLTVNFDPDTKRVTIEGVQRMQHMTLGIDSIQPAHPAGDYRFWRLDAFRSDPLTEQPGTPYYLYAQCSTTYTTVDGRREGTGRFYLSPDRLALEDARHPGMFNFWVGFLNSEYDGDRSFRTVYGYTEVLPGQVTTDRLVSSDGRTYIDLLEGVIAGNIKFRSTGGDLKDVQTGIDEAVDAMEVGARNWIARKYLLDWNETRSGITEQGSDEDGDYLAVDQRLLYLTVGNGGVYSDVFQGKIKYKSGTQYAFKIRWKMAGAQKYTGLALYVRYTDGTSDNMVGLDGSRLQIIESAFITAADKTVDKIYASYGTNDYRTLIYDIQLTEGNKQVAGYLVAPEDQKSDIINDVELGTGGVHLLKNGRGEYGDNTYFQYCEYRGEQYDGSSGAFVLHPNPTQSSGFGSQLIPVDTQKAYRVGGDIRSKNARHKVFVFLAAYDIDRNLMMSRHVVYMAGTTTKLGRDLNNGDTVVYLDSLSGWNVTTDRSYQKGFIVWNYANSSGYVYPKETYSRNVYPDLYTDNAAVDKSSNRITLSKPWNGGHIPAGTELSQCNDGNSFQYFIHGVIPTTSWKHYEARVKGVRQNTLSYAYFYPGCAYVGLGWSPNYDRSPEEDEIYVANLFFNEDLPTREDVDNVVNERFDALKYLTEAITQGSTDILGGLLLTNILAVRNTAGHTVGGVSGMADNVAFWSGGTYQQAVEQAAGGGGNLPVLITKSPTGVGTKFGIFKIIPNGIQVDAVDGSSKIIVTNDTVEKVAPVQQTVSLNLADAGRYLREQSGAGSRNILDNAIEGSGSNMIGKVFEMSLGTLGGKYRIPSTRVTFNLSAHAECKAPNANRSWSYSYIGIRSFYMYLYKDSELLAKVSLGGAATALAQLPNTANASRTVSVTVGGEYDFGVPGNCRLVIGAQVDNTATIPTKDKIAVYNSVPVIGQTQTGRDYASAAITASGTLQLVGIGVYTVLGKDGMAVIANSESYFRVYNNESELNVQMKGLPTTNVMLDPGQLWRDGNTIKIMS